MIKIENLHTCNWEAAIRSMRNPMNSWDKSDSAYLENRREFVLGEADHKLALQLAKAGSDHGKFLRSIIFSCDITAPLYWWKEMDTYKVGTVRNSCSTMHKIMAKEFTEDDFSHDYICGEVYSIDIIVNACNKLRALYLEGNRENGVESKDKRVWYNLIQLLPSSYNQKATWTANYAVLRNIYHARKNHKLYEWRAFCEMIEKLPYSDLITE